MKKESKSGLLIAFIVSAALFYLAYISLFRTGAFPFSNSSVAEMELTDERIEEMRDLLRCAVLYAPADARAEERPFVRAMSLSKAQDDAKNGASIRYYIDEKSKNILFDAEASSGFKATLLNEKDDVQEWMATYHIKGRGEMSFKYIARGKMIAPVSVSTMPDNYRALRVYSIIILLIAAFVSSLLVRRIIYTRLIIIDERIRESAVTIANRGKLIKLILFAIIYAALFTTANKALFSPTQTSLVGGMSERWKMNLYCLTVVMGKESGEQAVPEMRLKSLYEIEKNNKTGAAAVSYYVPERLKDKLAFPWDDIAGFSENIQDIRLIDERDNYQMWEITRQIFYANRGTFRYIALEDALIPVSVRLTPWVLSFMLLIFMAPVSAIIAMIVAKPVISALERKPPG